MAKQSQKLCFVNFKNEILRIIFLFKDWMPREFFGKHLLVSSLSIRNAVLKSWIEEPQAQEGVNTLFELVCQVGDELLQIKHVQASKMRGCGPPLQIPSLRSLYIFQIAPNGAPEIVFPDRASRHPEPIRDPLPIVLFVGRSFR